MSDKLKRFLNRIKNPADRDELARRFGHESAAAVPGDVRGPLATSHRFQGAHVDDMADQLRRDKAALGITGDNAPGPVQEGEEGDDVTAPETAEAVRQQINRDRVSCGLNPI